MTHPKPSSPLDRHIPSSFLTPLPLGAARFLGGFAALDTLTALPIYQSYLASGAAASQQAALPLVRAPYLP